MDTQDTLWSAGVTCEKTLETHTTREGTKLITTKTWKFFDVLFDLNPAEPQRAEYVCPYCGNTFRIVTAPRKDVSLTAEDVESKFAANIKKRVLQWLLSILISAAFLPGLLMDNDTLLIIGMFVAIVGVSMLFYFTVITFRNLRDRGRFRRSGTVPIGFHMQCPYSVKIEDPLKLHYWKKYRKTDIQIASALEFADLPPVGNIDETPEFNRGLARR